MTDVNLDEILADLDPKAIQKKIKQPHRAAYRSFDHKSLPDEDIDYASFRDVIVKYTQHHYKATNNGADLPSERAFATARQLLEITGEQGRGGFKAALQKAKDGDLDDVIKQLSEMLEQEHQQAYQTDVLGRVDPTDFETHKEIAGKLIDTYKPLLDDPKSADEMAPQYESLIRSHSDLSKAIRRTYNKKS